jgi:hypothetical protein
MKICSFCAELPFERPILETFIALIEGVLLTCADVWRSIWVKLSVLSFYRVVKFMKA